MIQTQGDIVEAYRRVVAKRANPPSSTEPGYAKKMANGAAFYYRMPEVKSYIEELRKKRLDYVPEVETEIPLITGEDGQPINSYDGGDYVRKDGTVPVFEDDGTEISLSEWTDENDEDPLSEEDKADFGEMEKYLRLVAHEARNGAPNADLIQAQLMVIKRALKNHQYPAASAAIDRIAKMRKESRTSNPTPGFEMNEISGMTTRQLVIAVCDGLPLKQSTIDDLANVLGVRYKKIDYGEPEETSVR